MFGASFKYIFHGDRCERYRNEKWIVTVAFYMRNATCARILPTRRVDSASEIIQIKKETKERGRRSKRERMRKIELRVCLGSVYIYALLNVPRKASVIAHSPWFWGCRFTQRVLLRCTYFFTWGSDPSKCLRQIDNIAVARAVDDRNTLWRHQPRLFSHKVVNYISQR